MCVFLLATLTLFLSSALLCAFSVWAWGSSRKSHTPKNGYSRILFFFCCEKASQTNSIFDSHVDCWAQLVFRLYTYFPFPCSDFIFSPPTFSHLTPIIISEDIRRRAGRRAFSLDSSFFFFSLLYTLLCRNIRWNFLKHFFSCSHCVWHTQRGEKLFPAYPKAEIFLETFSSLVCFCWDPAHRHTAARERMRVAKKKKSIKVFRMRDEHTKKTRKIFGGKICEISILSIFR